MAIVIYGWLIAAMATTVIGWFMFCGLVAVLMFGDDRAFVVGPVVATILCTLIWLVATGFIQIA